MNLPTPSPPTITLSRLNSAILRLALLLALWTILAEGLLDDPLFITLAISSTLTISYLTIPIGSWHIHPLKLISFLPFFLYHSFLGGLDVARRALHPKCPLQPAIKFYPLQSNHNQQLILTWIVSLLPGTASVHLNNNSLTIHVLDETLPFSSRIHTLEKHITRFCS